MIVAVGEVEIEEENQMPEVAEEDGVEDVAVEMAEEATIPIATV
jgi:hypothetical protein